MAAATRHAQKAKDPWPALERAHILSQPWAGPHCAVHLAMLRVAWKQRNWREWRAQLIRLAVAAPGSLMGRYPPGNTGRADMALRELAAIPPDLATLIRDSSAHARRSHGTSPP